MDTMKEMNFMDLASVASNLSMILKKLTDLSQADSLSQQLDQFGHEVITNPRSVSTLKQRFSELVGKVKDLTSSRIPQIMAKNKKCLSPSDISCIREEIQKVKVKMAEDMVKQGAMASALIMLVQIWRIKEVWDAVKDAKNVICESRRTIDSIRAEIGQLQRDALELGELMTRYESGTEQEKRNLMTRLRVKISRTSTKFANTQALLTELKVEINGKRHELVIYQREQVSNAIMNGVNGVANLIQCVQSWNMLGTGLRVLQVGVTAGFFGIAAGNAVMYCITESTLKEIQNNLNEIAEMKRQLASVERTINDAEDFLLQHVEDY